MADIIDWDEIARKEAFATWYQQWLNIYDYQSKTPYWQVPKLKAQFEQDYDDYMNGKPTSIDRTVETLFGYVYIDEGQWVAIGYSNPRKDESDGE